MFACGSILKGRGGGGGGWEVSGREEVTMSLALLHMLNEMLSIHELL